MRTQRWLGLFAVPSPPASSRTGNDPPAVRGPFDAENSVDTIEPPATRILPAVAATAWLLRLSSSSRGWESTVALVAAPS